MRGGETVTMFRFCARLCAIAAIAFVVILGGCAAADPTGGAFGESVAGGARQRPRCPPGEMLICELKSPNRVSDGRYGYHGNKQQRCGCHPERDVLDLGQSSLPGDKR